MCGLLGSDGTVFINPARYIPDCKISLASFVKYFHLWLIRSFIRIRLFFFVALVLTPKFSRFMYFLADLKIEIPNSLSKS